MTSVKKNASEASAAPKTQAKKSTRGRKGFDPSVQKAVIDSVERLIAANGLDAVKARAIAGDAKISVGSVYNMFGDMDGLIRRANARTYDALLTVVSTALKEARAAKKSLREELMDLSLAYLDFVATHQKSWLAVLTFNRRQTDVPPNWYLAKELALLQVIEEAIGDFPITQDDEFRHNTARAMWASVHGIVTIAVGDGFIMQGLEKVKEQINVIVTGMSYYLEHPEIGQT